MAKLTLKISELEEREFNLRSTDFFRPPLKQIGNSIYEIKIHYMSQESINIIPQCCKPRLAGIRDTFMRHLEDDCFLYKASIVTGGTIESGDDKQQRASTLIVLMDSLALAMDFEVLTRPDDVQCDILLAICGQPVMVITVADGDKDSRAVRKYNTSVARGVTLTLRRFMDEGINVVFGVLSDEDLTDMNYFQTCLQRIVKNSSFVTRSTLTTNQTTYEKIVTAFWAGVAETRSLISRDGRVDTDYLRFLTKDQCVILMENINNREVEVEFQTGTGATTLMVEVARRLSKLDDTLLVCRSQEEKEKLKSVYPNTITVAEMKQTDLSRFTNIVGETGAFSYRVGGKLWTFTKIYSETEQLQLQLQHDVKTLANENANTEKMILLISSADRRDKMNHLFRETEILKLLDISFQGLITAYHLPTSLVLEVLPVKQHSTGDRDRNQRLETEDYMRHVVDQLKQGIAGRRDLFPLLGDMMRQIKCILPYLQVKTEYLKQACSAERRKFEDSKNQTGHSADDGFPRVERGKLVGQTDIGNECVPGKSPNTELKERHPVQGGRPGVIIQEGVSDRTNAEQIDELEKKLGTLKEEAERKKHELNEIYEATDHSVEWEYNMDCLSQHMAELKIHDIITDIIGEDEIPVITDIPQKPFSFLGEDCCSRRPGGNRSQVHQLRHQLQFGRLGQNDLMAIVRELITDDQIRLTHLRKQSDHLELEYGCPIHIVGELECEKSGPVSCPAMTLDPDRVHEDLSVSESGELVNGRGSGGDHRGGRLQYYWGTCSRLPIPLPPSPSTLTAPRYWETQSRIQMKDVSRFVYIQELGVCGEEEVDTRETVAVQSGSSWCVRAVVCTEHGDICTWVWGERRSCGGCHRNYLSLTPGTGVHTIHWGVILDIGRGRLAFVDVTRGRVIHKFNVDIREYLRPMFGVAPYSNCDVKMKLLSGSEIAMDDRKKSLIAEALFSAANVSE